MRVTGKYDVEKQRRQEKEMTSQYFRWAQKLHNANSEKKTFV